jgi:hypothetical protein
MLLFPWKEAVFKADSHDGHITTVQCGQERGNAARRGYRSHHFADTDVGRGAEAEKSGDYRGYVGKGW